MSEREEMQYDVLVVGAGPAGLACAIRLKQLKPELAVCLIEKGSTIGAHILSGAVIETEALDQLWPEWRDTPPPVCIPAKKDRFLYLGKSSATRLPTPPQMHNEGNVIVSLGALCAWLADYAESIGVEVYPGFAASELLYQGDKVCGVRIGDFGLDQNGQPTDNYTAGVDIIAGTTVLSEGCRGHLSKSLIKKFQLDQDRESQTYGVGIKELWQLPSGRVDTGLVVHSLGWPLASNTYGGGFIYHLDGDRLAIGFVAGLDYSDPGFSPFEAFQQFKHHPVIHKLLEGGEIISSGARALSEGGYAAIPKLETAGAMLIGDAAGTLNVAKIKGTHTALASGMLAAAHLAEHGSSEGFDACFHASDIASELRRVRNIRPGFKFGLIPGLLNAAWETLTAGLSPWTLKNPCDHSALRANDSQAMPASFERDLPPRDRLAWVYFAATEHNEQQPVHLDILDPAICIERCSAEYGNPCTRFCPAGVYEMSEGENGPALQINAANCVHCKTCDIKDPYQNINWMVPEGGSGPNYTNL